MRLPRHCPHRGFEESSPNRRKTITLLSDYVERPGKNTDAVAPARRPARSGVLRKPNLNKVARTRHRLRRQLGRDIDSADSLRADSGSHLMPALTSHRRPSRLLGGVVVARLCRRSGASSSPQPSAGAFLDGRLDERALGIAPPLPRQPASFLRKRAEAVVTRSVCKRPNKLRQ